MLYDYTGVELKKYPTLIGDGIADDSDALQALVDSRSGIVIPSGLTIRLTKAINIDIDKLKLFDGGNCQFVMDGYDRYIFNVTGSMLPGMTADPKTTSDKQLISESGFIIQNCKCTSSDPTIGAAIKISGCIDITVKNIYAVKMKKGIVIEGANRNLIIQACNLYVLTECGIHIKDSTNLHQVNIVNNLIQYTKTCLFIDNPEQIANVQLVGNDIEICTYPDTDYPAQRSVLITSDDVKTGIMAEFVFSGNTIQGHSKSDCIIEIYGGSARKVREITITGNVISNVITSNIILKNCMIASVCSNVFCSDQRPNIQDNYCVSLESCTDMSVTGNSYAAIGHFLQADEDCNNIVVVGNCGACKYDAIEIAEGATVETYGNSSRYQDSRPW